LVALGIVASWLTLACGGRTIRSNSYDTDDGSTNSGSGGSSAGTSGDDDPMVGEAGAGTIEFDAGAAGSPSSIGTGASGGMPPKPQVRYLLIDDLEDGDIASNAVGENAGRWFALSSGTGSIDPNEAAETFAMPSGAEGSNYSAFLRGTHLAKWGALLAVTLDFDPDEGWNAGKPFDASKYDGISFWIRGSGAIHVQIETAEIADESGGGDCSGQSCWGFWEKFLYPTDEWQKVELDFFSDLVQPMYANVVPLNPARILRITFLGAAPEFEFWLDDLAFFSKPDP
jgi:hypothetical protein